MAADRQRCRAARREATARGARPGSVPGGDVARGRRLGSPAFRCTARRSRATGARRSSSCAVISAMYEVYALKYAHHARRASENFIGGDPHDGPMPLDYFVWLVRGQGVELVVDTGFSSAMAAKRGREHLRCPTHGLRLLGVDAASVKDVVITHLHYDHVGNFELFPAATLH